MAHSNLESFLKYTTPSVRSQFHPKTAIRKFNMDWQLLGGKETMEYFTLEDLWDCFDEWSAYGAGAPLHLSNGETLVQYYTPYLSAIQIYTGKPTVPRDVGEDPYGEFETDSISGDSEDGKLSRSSSNSSSRTWDSEDSCTDQEGDLKTKDRLGELYFQYFESNSPHLRLPLKDMIDTFAKQYPGLKSFRSVDLFPASWMAVAWYPIYHIPAQRNPREVYSAFLTFHTLSSSFQDDVSMVGGKAVCCTDDARSSEVDHRGESNIISLPPFGLATYRMQSQVWIDSRTEDGQSINSLLSAAASWLMQLQVVHPDFLFFVNRSV